MIEKIIDDPEIWAVNVPLPENPLKNLNSYIIRSEDEVLVIDTGFNREECRKALVNSLNLLEIDWNKTSLFLTHFHSDHIGLVKEFTDRNCKIYMGRLDYIYYRNVIKREKNAFMSEQLLIEGMPKEIMDLQVKSNDGKKYAPKEAFDAIMVDDGEFLRVGNLETKCILTPGHTPGHMMLYLQGQQILFSGDHILFDITPNIGIWQDVKNSLGDYLQSLNNVRNLPVRLVLPAHRKNDGDYRLRIDQILEHHKNRLIEIFLTVQDYPGIDAYGIASKITWSMRGMAWKDVPAGQKWFATSETLAHLRYLEIANMIERKIEDGKARYFEHPATCELIVL